MPAIEESGTFDLQMWEKLGMRKPGNLTHLTYFYVPKEDLMFPVLGFYLQTQFNRMRRASLLKGLFIPKNIWIRFYDQDGDNFVRNIVTVVIWHRQVKVSRVISKLKLSALSKIKCH